MKCPKCAAEVVDGAADCASCGIFFEKWRRLQERKKEEAVVQKKALELPPPPAPAINPWTIRIAAGSIALAWILGLTWITARDIRRIRADKAIAPVSVQPTATAPIAARAEARPDSPVPPKTISPPRDVPFPPLLLPPGVVLPPGTKLPPGVEVRTRTAADD